MLKKYRFSQINENHQTLENYQTLEKNKINSVRKEIAKDSLIWFLEYILDGRRVIGF